MSSMKYLGIFAILTSCLNVGGPACAQQPNSSADPTQNKQLGTTAATLNKLILGFRMLDWKAKHVNEPEAAKVHAETLRKLGCEIENLEHAGHTDLRYRCPEWKQIELPNHDAAHKWQDYLNKAGFETAHEH